MEEPNKKPAGSGFISFFLITAMLVAVAYYAMPSLERSSPLIKDIKAFITGSDSKILETGHPGKAQILSVNQTNVYLNKNPQVEMEVKVTPNSGGAPYNTKIRMFIQMAHIPQFQPGKTYHVKISREERMDVVFDFQKKK